MSKCRGCGAEEYEVHHKACPDYKEESHLAQDPAKAKPKSPWARRLEEMPNLTEADKESLRQLEALQQKIKPCLTPTEWKETAEPILEKIHEIHCAISHLFRLGQMSDDIKATILAELFGGVVGEHATSHADATLTIALYCERMVLAAKAEISDRQIKKALSNLMRGPDAGRPN